MLPLLAEITPISAQWQTGLLSLLAIVALVLAIQAHFRRKPPIDTELVKIHASVEHLSSAAIKLDQWVTEITKHAGKIETLEGKVNALESHRESDIAQQREYVEKVSREIFGQVRSAVESFNANIQQVERALGILEGQLKGLGK
jgi:predicted  nucleic acid-binding Zn-ribbon protein